jgi:RecB family endonuclease NucS
MVTHRSVDGILVLVDITDKAKKLHDVGQIAPRSLENEGCSQDRI